MREKRPTKLPGIPQESTASTPPPASSIRRPLASASGISFLLLALCYFIIDVRGHRRWATPFMAIGANSIFAYMAWQLCSSAFRRVAEVFLGGLKLYAGPWHETIIAAGTFAVLWMLLGYLYRKGTFIRI